MSTPDSSAMPLSVEIYDTTLRDGAQLEGISLTVDDKLRIAEQLDRLGVHYIEGGWPGSNPKDDEFFDRAQSELELANSQLVAFGSTRRVKGKVDDDLTLQHLLAANTAVVCIVGKTSEHHLHIGRASCWVRVQSLAVAVSSNIKHIMLIMISIHNRTL